MPRSRSRSRSRSRPHSRARSRSRHGSGEKIARKPRKRATPRKQRKKEKPLAERTLAELQMIARSHGVPFGGMTRTQLIEKIAQYH